MGRFGTAAGRHAKWSFANSLELIQANIHRPEYINKHTHTQTYYTYYHILHITHIVKFFPVVFNNTVVLLFIVFSNVVGILTVMHDNTIVL